ncbi:hypothetical protein EDD22DRAFT_853867 [Suillus occidentalis]|nr:hypothetical protein EDD22DRAFT_853867 [Suillus occidentalis]
MARKDENKQPKAQWNEAEVDALLDYLITQKSKIAGTTFKDEVFNEASNIIAGMGTYGSSKTRPQCKMKWASLKQTHNAIERYRNNQSGCHWDNVNRVNIQGEAAEAQWGQFLSASVANKAMRFFKNTGWRFWPKMLEILPNGSGAEGTAAYNPALLATQESAPATSASAKASGSLPTQASAPAASASAEASGSAIPTTRAEASGEAMGLAIGVPSACNAGGVPSARTAASPGFEWDQIMSALPSTDPGMVARASMNIPPPPSSIAYTHSSTRKCSHSDMVLSSTTTQTSVSQVNSPSLDKKPKLLTCGGSSILRVTSQCTGTKATMDTANTAAFMNLQGSINRLMDSLETSLTKTDDGQVADEHTQALDIMQDDERISPSDKVTLMNVFVRSPAVSSTYLVSRPENCIPYLESVLRQAANGVYSAL